MNGDEDINKRLEHLEEQMSAKPEGGVYPRLGYEYKSKARILGIPLVHVASGIDPQTGRLLVARGIIAVGNVSFGVLSIGGIAFGVVSLGGLAFGVGGQKIEGELLGGHAVMLVELLGVAAPEDVPHALEGQG